MYIIYRSFRFETAWEGSRRRGSNRFRDFPQFPRSFSRAFLSFYSAWRLMDDNRFFFEFLIFTGPNSFPNIIRESSSDKLSPTTRMEYNTLSKFSSGDSEYILDAVKSQTTNPSNKYKTQNAWQGKTVSDLVLVMC